MSALCCLALTAGKLLNNTNANGPGYTYGAEVSAYHVRYNYQRIGSTVIADNMAYSTLSLTQSYKRLTFAIGTVPQMTYSAHVWWEGRKYVNDTQHFSKSCRWCGVSYAVDYAVTNHLSVRASYVSQMNLDPTYNGLTLGVVYGFHR